VVSLENFNAARVNRLLDQMTRAARKVVDPALGGAKASVQIIADCRYVGQGHEIRVIVPVRRLADKDGTKLKALFEATYEQVYGLRIPNQEAEAITWSVTVSSPAKKPKRASKVSQRAAAAPKRKRQIYDPALGRMVNAPVYWRFDMAPGASVKGPCIIAEDETSTIVGANFRARINSLGYIMLERAS
jgi:N-methylhydantoinase A